MPLASEGILDKQVIVERIDTATGEVVAARTVRGESADCCLVGNEMPIGVVNVVTEDAVVTIQVSGDPHDYQQAQMYGEKELVQSLLLKEGAVIYVDKAARLR